MLRWRAVLVLFTSLVFMSFCWKSSTVLLQAVLPVRLWTAVTMATESDYQAGHLSAAFVTVPGSEAGEKLASEIVKQKLAGCVNIIPGLTSIYEWEGKIEQDKEVLLMIKTRTSKIDALSEFVRKNHPNDVAEVISFPIQNGNLPYLQWLENTMPK